MFSRKLDPKQHRQATAAAKAAEKRGDSKAAQLHRKSATYHSVTKRDIRKEVKQVNGKRSWF